MSLVDKIFTETGDARSRIISCEEKIVSAHIASKSDEVPNEIKERWEKCWEELNEKNEWYSKGGRLIQSSLVATVLSKRNKTMEKHLHFFLEEFYRVINLKN